MGQILAQIAEGVWGPEAEAVMTEDQERLELLGLRARTAQRVQEATRAQMSEELRRVRKEELAKAQRVNARLRGFACYLLGGGAFLGALAIYCGTGDLGLTALPVIFGGLLCRWIR